MSEAETTASPPRLVLAVDDDDHTRNLLRDLCESLGFRVVTAEDGARALEHIAHEPPSLVLLDLMMPKRDGFSVLRAMRESADWKHIPVIILSAMGDLDGKIRAMELGADDYVTKPFKLIELQTRMSAALTVQDYRRRLQSAEDELTTLRALDPVTGAGTYAQLKVSLDSEIARSRRYGRPMAAIVFGFDDYQSLRYQLGRDGCDQYVAGLAQKIRGGLRGADRLFRLDVDEFVVLLPETDFKGARNAAERLLSVAQTLSPEGKSGVIRPTIRFGGATFPSELVKTTEDLLREANRTYRELQNSRSSLIF